MTISVSSKVNNMTAEILFIDKEGNILNHNDQPLYRDILNYAQKELGFNGDYGQVKEINLINNSCNRTILVGIGCQNEISYEKIRRALSRAVKSINNVNGEVVLKIYKKSKVFKAYEVTKALSEAAVLSQYEFKKYISKNQNLKPLDINIIVHEEDLELCKGAVNEGIILGEATALARDLVNEPANIATPEFIAQKVEEVCSDLGVEVQIMNESGIKNFGMKAFMEVAKGSSNHPRLIVMRYNGNKESNERVALVGKGVTYDSGGLTIKPGDRLIQMKHDMAGAATVIGAIVAIAKAKLKVNVVAIVAACENMVSGNCYRPGDIISSMAGKSIFIGSTDAEGRLTLVDAITYAIKYENVTSIVDVASLTGVARKSFGNVMTPILCNDEILYYKLELASKASGEKIFRMPIDDEYRVFLKHDLADLTNASGEAGMITAGMFIGEFIEDKKWIHMDIAGTCWSNSDSNYFSKGGTGVGVRTLYQLAKEI